MGCKRGKWKKVFPWMGAAVLLALVLKYRIYAGVLILAVFLAGTVGTILFMQGAYHNRETDDREQEEFLEEWKRQKEERKKGKKMDGKIQSRE
ncbi:MAG: hypothetical protein KH828_00325 [Clostridiales bacterium]|nr:hypothetical protein [Clostridiales bacterium]